MSVFDKDSFLSTSTAGAMDDKFTPVPMATYKGCYIDDVTVETWTDKDKNEQPIIVLHIAILDEAVKKLLGSDKPIVRDKIFVDREPDGSLSLGKNKNIRLGQYRTAVKQNTPKPWNPGMLKGAGPVSVKVGHRFNKETGEGPYAQIDAVAAG